MQCGITDMTNHKAVKIQGRVQAYQWGGTNFLPELLGYTNPSQRPQAEYWLGAHPCAPSSISGREIALGDFLSEQQAPPLQFLLKILDVRDMLSIQVHPNKEQAKAGFARENALGIALDAKNRNYKDANDKPELMVALSEFWLLHGFRPIAQIAELLENKSYLAPLRDILLKDGLAQAFAHALEFSSSATQTMQQTLAQELRDKSALDKNTPEFWIQRWLEKNPTVENGILTLYFLNLIKVEPGMAVYQPDGLLHAYLEGQNVELMANSDNVLRAGLTPKHIDVAELLSICTIEPSNPNDYVIHPEIMPNGERRFITPFTEFELAELNAQSQSVIEWDVTAPEIIFCYQGSATLNATLDLQKGESALLLPGEKIALHLQKDAILFKARNLP